MHRPPCHVSAASRIVSIQQEVQASDLHPSYRERLLTEQRTIWEAIFPETPFDQIEAITH